MYLKRLWYSGNMFVFHECELAIQKYKNIKMYTLCVTLDYTKNWSESCLDSDWRSTSFWPSLFLLFEWIQPTIDQLCSHTDTEQDSSTTLRTTHIRTDQGLKNVLIQTCMSDFIQSAWNHTHDDVHDGMVVHNGPPVTEHCSRQVAHHFPHLPHVLFVDQLCHEDGLTNLRIIKEAHRKPSRHCRSGPLHVHLLSFPDRLEWTCDPIVRRERSLMPQVVQDGQSIVSVHERQSTVFTNSPVQGPYDHQSTWGWFRRSFEVVGC